MQRQREILDTSQWGGAWKALVRYISFAACTSRGSERPKIWRWVARAFVRLHETVLEEEEEDGPDGKQ
jgi:hypothetical protein